MHEISDGEHVYLRSNGTAGGITPDSIMTGSRGAVRSDYGYVTVGTVEAPGVRVAGHAQHHELDPHRNARTGAAPGHGESHPWRGPVGTDGCIERRGAGRPATSALEPGGRD